MCVIKLNFMQVFNVIWMIKKWQIVLQKQFALA